jgi:hypothetical protein
MKEETRWKVLVGIILITLTLLLMTVHYTIFQDSHHLFIYFLGDLAFVPVEVLCVTLIIDQMLESREQQKRMEKLNMVIGVFFSRTGIPLLSRLARADSCVGPLRVQVAADTAWTPERFRAMYADLGEWPCKVDPNRIHLNTLRDSLLQNEDFLLRIVENPMVFEHESFTDLLLAVAHLTEELKARDDLSRCPPSDIAHLTGDIERVYSRLMPEWLRYMEYLQRSYPYLFSLAMRQNPFDETANVQVK